MNQTNCSISFHSSILFSCVYHIIVQLSLFFLYAMVMIHDSRALYIICYNMLFFPTDFLLYFKIMHKIRLLRPVGQLSSKPCGWPLALSNKSKMEAFWIKRSNYNFIHEVTLARGQRRDLSVFKSSCHLSTTHGGGFILSRIMLNVKQGSCECQFEPMFYHFSSLCFIHMITD